VKIKIIDSPLFIDKCNLLVGCTSPRDKVIGLIGSSGVKLQHDLVILPLNPHRKEVYIDGKLISLLCEPARFLRVYSSIKDELPMYLTSDTERYEDFCGVYSNNYSPNLSDLLNTHRIITTFYLHRGPLGRTLSSIKHKVLL